jgi:hypothetical protein
VHLFTHGAVPHVFKWRDYVPKWSEFAVIYLDVLVKDPSQSRWMMKGALTEV